MCSAFNVPGTNSKAPFTLKIHRGDGMALLAMNWRKGKPPRDFVGFAIEFSEPGSTQFWPVMNLIGFPGQRTKQSDPPVESTKAPFQKFRWVHFPFNAEKKGKFTYRVTPLFMDAASGDFHLAPGSPGIDAALADSAPEVDLEGRAREDDPAVPNTGAGTPAYGDLGAFEGR